MKMLQCSKCTTTDKSRFLLLLLFFLPFCKLVGGILIKFSW